MLCPGHLRWALRGAETPSQLKPEGENDLGWVGINSLNWLMNAGVAAVACKAPWPARQVAPSPILHDFKSLCAPNYKAMCPDQWAQHGRSCMAPPHYKVASFGQNCLMLQVCHRNVGKMRARPGPDTLYSSAERCAQKMQLATMASVCLSFRLLPWLAK